MRIFIQLYVEHDEKNITLSDICYAPLSDQFTGPPTISACTVQSALGYFGVSSEDFEFADDKLKNLTQCAS